MASKSNVGDTVRINENYLEIIYGRYAKDKTMENRVGTEFKVTAVNYDPAIGYYVAGDPNGWGVLEQYLDVVVGDEADRVAKVGKTTAAIRRMGENLDAFLRVDRLSENAHRHLVNLLDDITDAIQEERA